MTKAQIQQWLQYRVTVVDRCLNEKDVTTVLKVQYVCSKHEIKKRREVVSELHFWCEFYMKLLIVSRITIS